MKIYEIGTGYTPIPAQMGAATEIVVEELTRAMINNGEFAEIIDIKPAEWKLRLSIKRIKVREERKAFEKYLEADDSKVTIEDINKDKEKSS